MGSMGAVGTAASVDAPTTALRLFSLDAASAALRAGGWVGGWGNGVGSNNNSKNKQQQNPK